MKITVLVENSVSKNGQPGLKSEHGLSIHIEVNKTNILFDVGKTDLFSRNSKKLNIDLSKVDYLIISHGHYDHGGGLKHFLKINNKAIIYMHKKAINKHFTKIFGFIPFNISLDSNIINKNRDRIVFVDEDMHLTDNIDLLADFPDDFPQPTGNLSLYEKYEGIVENDKFQHEIALLINENDNSVLFTACSHSGIINMYKKAESFKKNEKINYVFGGFHTYNPATRKNESKNYLDNLTTGLKETDSLFYTGHCTGKQNLDYLKEKLDNKIFSMNTGDIIEI